MTAVQSEYKDLQKSYQQQNVKIDEFCDEIQEQKIEIKQLEKLVGRRDSKIIKFDLYTKRLKQDIKNLEEELKDVEKKMKEHLQAQKNENFLLLQ